MIPANNKKRCAAFPFETGIRFRRKIDFFSEEDATKSYSGFESEPTRLQAESHSHHTGWATSTSCSREKLHRLSTIDSGVLPYEVVFVVDKPYMIIATIDVANGLANGTVGKLSHFELDDQNRVLRVWLLFTNCVGVKARGKMAGYANAKGIIREMVPINSRSATVPINRNRSIHAKRNHFPLKPACSLKIHKLQGDTFDETVYKCINAHSQPLIYIAVFEVTAQE
ncbi:ATP-dependent DNA helicase [Trichonephila clavipes]|nr:ATP-dependent DNA helicase [Trichonephila clavipes]